MSTSKHYFNGVLVKEVEYTEEETLRIQEECRRILDKNVSLDKPELIQESGIVLPFD